MDSQIPILFIHSGDRVPRALRFAALLAAARYGANRVIVASDREVPGLSGSGIRTTAIRQSSTHSLHFEQSSRLDRGFRKGFWHLTAKRLFILADLMEQLEIDKVWHVENDNALLAPPQDLDDALLGSRSIWVPFGSEDKAVASVLYAGSQSALEEVINRIASIAKNQSDQSEMVMLARSAADGAPIEPLPTMLDASWVSPTYSPEYDLHVGPEYQWKHGNRFDCIFDAMALGQYLLGQDPANQGYFHENLFRSDLMSLEPEQLTWSTRGRGATADLIVTHRHREVAVGNLHIHSKVVPNRPEEWCDYLNTWCEYANQKQAVRSLLIRRMLSEIAQSPRESIYLPFQWVRIARRTLARRSGS